jgi:hypothetical protein
VSRIDRSLAIAISASKYNELLCFSKTSVGIHIGEVRTFAQTEEFVMEKDSKLAGGASFGAY